MAEPILPAMMRPRLRFLLLLVLLGTFAPGAPARADAQEQDTVRQAVASGAIRPLAEILDAVRGQLPGDVVGVDIEHKKQSWLYELRVLARSGRVFEVYVDASSGKIERIKEK